MHVGEIIYTSNEEVFRVSFGLLKYMKNVTLI